MELVGKYTIGGRVLNRDGTPVEGVYVIGKYGFAYLCANLEEKLEKDDRIIVFDDLETAQNYVRYLSRLYRYEFRDRAKRLGVQTDEFRYYLLKLTDGKFANTRIGVRSSEKMRKDSHKRYQFIGDYNKVRLKSIEPIKKD
jgi:hypothetical protein